MNMSPDTVAMIVMGVCAGMVGTIYAGLRKQVDSIEARLTKRLEKLEARIEAEVKDMQQDVRHRVAEMHTSVFNSIQAIPMGKIDDFATKAELLTTMLARRGLEEVRSHEDARTKISSLHSK